MKPANKIIASLLLLVPLLLPLRLAAFGLGDLQNLDLNKLKGQIATGTSIFTSMRKGVSDLTPEEEYYIGRSVSARILNDYPPLPHSAIADYINQMGHYLAQFSERPETFAGYRFQLVDSDEINAFAAPGGNIMISRGLYQALTSEEQLAAILAHEIAHVSLQHGLNAIKKANLTQAFTLIGETALKESGRGDKLAQINELTSIFSTSIDDIVSQLVVNGYSRSQELEADQQALILCYRAGYSPQGLAEFLATLEQGSSQQAGGGFYATHPAAADRLTEVNATLQQWSAIPDSAPRTARFQKHRL
ncbi:MAG: M48 family metalloprotease [Gammaproteobacteria bacterium]|nr:M48 family metalloprotease [Gammaproteobacteria bacterium]